MEYQRLVRKTTESGHVTELKLIRDGNEIVISSDSPNQPEKVFYFAWRKCKHPDEIIVLNPPQLCHIFKTFTTNRGSTIASICPRCTKSELDVVNCHIKKRVNTGKINYVVTDLTLFPNDMYVYECNGEITINVGTYNTLPDDLKAYCEPILYRPNAIVLRDGPLIKEKKRKLVGEIKLSSASHSESSQSDVTD